jgi:hypothetical protein
MRLNRLLLTGFLLLGTSAFGNPDPSGPEGPILRLGLQRMPLPFPIDLMGRPDTIPPVPTASGGDTLPDGSPQESQEQKDLFHSDFAQLDFLLQGRGELGGDWTRFRPCESGLQESCEPTFFPQLKPEVQFDLTVGGTIVDRIYVDVDYSENREFAATNNVNIFYQGQEGEFVQRVEVGDVSLRFPESRFLTQGIPAGNFGFSALTEFGPWEVQAVGAQQNGDISSREFQLSGVGGRQAFIQEDTLTLDDADFVRGQFFFLVDPREITGFPHLDVLALEPGAAPANLVPGAEPVQLYRFENDPITRQQVEGYIQAEAWAERDGVRVTESGWFRHLQPGVDYFLHPSGLWLALRRPLRGEEMLAATYVTSAGDTVGSYNPEQLHNSGEQPELRLLKASGPKHQPGNPTWEMEMHQVYRISGSDDVEASSVSLTLSLGELSGGQTFKRQPTGEEITLLRLLGLDEAAPVDQVDPTFIYRPAQEFFQQQSPVSGTFIVFPTLRPFAEPPPIPSLGLSAEETAEILGPDSNPIIYESMDPVERDNGGLFRLTIPFRIRNEGVVSTFSLGALGIRDGSERIYFGERLLVQGQDYVIDYDVGQVTLLSADALFATDPQAIFRADWEQKALFQIAPTAIFGFNARYGLGERGGIHLLGLFQEEKTLQNRPQLGMEPSSILMGGLNGDVLFGAGWLDGLVAKVPGIGADTTSSLRVQGEMALSIPNPNTKDEVYLDDFDSPDETPISLLERDWHLGSALEEEDGTHAALDAIPNETNVAPLTWQSSWILQGPEGDSLGVFEGFFPKRDIDQQINVAGTEVREPGLRLDFGSAGGSENPAPNWRAVTSVLSSTGTDLARTDYLEFYAAGGEELTLVLDLGRVGEDAFFVDEEGRTSGTHPETGRSWGLATLDQEADPRRGEIWNNNLDQQGMWVEACQGEAGQIYLPGDPGANCTRGNGRADSEDLDGDGRLTFGDRVYRYVVKLDGSSPYLARTTDETGTGFQLYRIPLRGPLALNVGGLVSEADWRAVKHLRITVVGPGSTEWLSLARLRLLGSRWVKRGQEGILQGWSGDVSGTGGTVKATPVSSLSEGAAYQSPPGVLEELDDPTMAYAGQGVEFNEGALSIEVRDLGPGERGEVYFRFPQRPRNLLSYRQARLWVVGQEGDWGAEGGEFFLKIGSDPDNFYLYRTRRPQPSGSSGVTTGDWLPEVVVDLHEWLSLRSQAEEELIENPPGAGGLPVAVWSADSTYAVFLKDRARAPNLAAVREFSLGIWNPTGIPIGGTLWVNEFRLDQAFQGSGYAGYVDMSLEAPGLLRSSLSYSGSGPFFRQLSGDPSYQADGMLAFYGTLEAGRVAPERWGVSLPLTVSHTRRDQDPTFLAQTDLRGDQIKGLRETGASDTRVEVGFRKTTPIGNPVLDPLLQGLSLRAGYSRNSLSTTTLETEGSGVDARAEFASDVANRDVAMVPGFARGLVRALLPRGLEDQVLETRFRWTPERVRFGTLYDRRRQESYRYEQILLLPDDGLVVPTLSPQEALETTAQVTFRPMGPLTVDISFFSIRDLLPPEESVQDPRLYPVLEDERWEAGFVDLGWETYRNLRNRIGFRPSLADWLRTDFVFSTDYLSDRNGALVEPVVQGTDTLFLLLRNANGNRTSRISLSVEPEPLARRLGLQVEGEEEIGGFLGKALTALDPLFLTRQGGMNSRFYRDPVDPGPGFQLGLEGPDDFRYLDGDTASIFTDRTTWTAGTGVRLPLNFRVSGNYSDSRTEILNLRSDRELRTRSWPDIRLSVTQVAIPAKLQNLLESLSLSSGYRQNLTETTFGGAGFQERVHEERQLPLDVNATWMGNITTRYSGSLSHGDGEDPTGDTRTERQSHTFVLSSVLEEPPLLGSHLDAPLRVSFGYRYSSDLNCRVPKGQESCIPFVDYLNRSLSLTLDTVITPLRVGLHMTYTDRQSFVGLHDGATQFQLGIFGEFLIDSSAPGSTPPPSNPPR